MIFRRLATARTAVPVANSMRVDFHCHSSISDGDLAPERLAATMREAGVCFAALTDHDTAAGQERFLKALRAQGIDGVSGAEIEAQSAEGPIHLLAYGFELGDTELSRALWAIRHPILRAGRKWMSRFGARRKSVAQTFLSAIHPRSIPRIGQAESPTSDSGEESGGGKNGGRSEDERLPPPQQDPDALKRGPLDVSDALRLIRRAGGRSFLAHPLTSLADPERLESLVSELAALGLDGIEAYYKPYREDRQRALADLAGRHGLLVSGGSDFHGHGFPHDAGPGIDMPDADWARFAKALRVESSGRPPA